MLWNKALAIEHKVAYIQAQQEKRGVNFDVVRARECIQELTDLIEGHSSKIREQLSHEVFVPYNVEVKRPFKINGDYTQAVENWYPNEKDREQVGGPFTRVEFKKPELSQRALLAKQFQRRGWKPEWKTEKGSPQLSRKGQVSPRLCKMFPEMGEHYTKVTTYSHRRSQIQGWLGNLRPDGRLTAGAFTNGTNTGRFRHTIVANVPKAKPDVLYGQEMRSLFIASEGNVLVGGDASGLELRMLCHYMNDPEYTEALLSGDIHSMNQELAGLPTRDNAKTFILITRMT